MQSYGIYSLSEKVVISIKSMVYLDKTNIKLQIAPIKQQNR